MMERSLMDTSKKSAGNPNRPAVAAAECTETRSAPNAAGIFRCESPTLHAPASASSAHTAALAELRSAVEMMHGLAQDHLGQIGAVAQLALDSLENPNGGSTWSLCHALELICHLAESADNDIGVQAELVGCSYVDPIRQRRFDACTARTAEQAAMLRQVGVGRLPEGVRS